MADHDVRYTGVVKQNQPYKQHTEYERLPQSEQIRTTPIRSTVDVDQQQVHQVRHQNTAVPKRTQRTASTSKKPYKTWALLASNLCLLLTLIGLLIWLLPYYFGSNNEETETTTQYYTGETQEYVQNAQNAENARTVRPGLYPVHDAIRQNNVYVLTDLINRNANLLTRDENNDTALHVASANGQLQSAKLLVERDARLINLTGKNQYYPIHYSAENGHCDIVEMLLNKGADPNSLANLPDEDIRKPASVTPLKLAATKGHEKCVRTLIEHGADLEVRDTNGWTPLQSAAYYGHYDVVKFLVDSGASTTAKTSDGKTALDMARLGKNQRVIDYLARI